MWMPDSWEIRFLSGLLLLKTDPKGSISLSLSSSSPSTIPHSTHTGVIKAGKLVRNSHRASLRLREWVLKRAFAFLCDVSPHFAQTKPQSLKPLSFEGAELQQTQHGVVFVKAVPSSSGRYAVKCHRSTWMTWEGKISFPDVMRTDSMADVRQPDGYGAFFVTA